MPAKNGSLGFVVKLVLVLAVLAGAGLLVFRSFAPTVIVDTVRRELAVDAVTGSVTVNADGGIRPLRSEAAGKVVQCDLLAADATFKKGDVLLQLDTADIERAMTVAKEERENALESARVKREKDPELRLAEEQLKNIKRLHEQGQRSDKELEAADLAVQKIKTTLALADLDAKKAEATFKAAMDWNKTLLSRMQILAPFDGSVFTPIAFPGAIVAQGEIVAMILADARVVTAKVGEDSIAKVKLKDPAKVTLLIYPGEQFDAEVTKISDTADETQRFNVFLEVKAPLARLKHGSTGEARITVGERKDTPVVARWAIFNDNKVHVVKDGRVEQRTVEIGFRSLNKVEVLSGLEPGEIVIVDNPMGYYPGQRVRLPKAPEKK